MSALKTKLYTGPFFPHMFIKKFTDWFVTKISVPFLCVFYTLCEYMVDCDLNSTVLTYWWRLSFHQGIRE